ncbi:MAG: hypothetical protein IV100_12605 [Myxococcales bacterium]|uniref:DUF6848 family protein n=1 Tax=Sediminibacterium sp. TaxID=1917865 RepID=UPI001D71BED1|nr:hypothetical protein [Sediminibacterium sp.]MBT9485840.1 hypothetical protein [Sediminibacterium sp.]MBT9556867.1 hypothetical protein [Myxococcales bacterium]
MNRAEQTDDSTRLDQLEAQFPGATVFEEEDTGDAYAFKKPDRRVIDRYMDGLFDTRQSKVQVNTQLLLDTILHPDPAELRTRLGSRPMLALRLSEEVLKPAGGSARFSTKLR